MMGCCNLLAMLLLLCGGWGAQAATTKLRIAYRPNTTALSPIDEDWTITYLLRPPSGERFAWMDCSVSKLDCCIG